MPKPDPCPGRHQLRVWMKIAIESGLIETLPPFYHRDGFESSKRTEEYARQILAELHDPEAASRPLREIITDARQFKAWVESRRKNQLKRALVQGRPEERIIDMPPGRPRTAPRNEVGSPRAERTSQPDTNPRLHPMWDDWIDSLEH